MPSRDLQECIEKHSDADRLGLVPERCWQPHPHISAGDVLLAMEGNPRSLWPSSNVDGDAVKGVDNQPDTAAGRSGRFPRFHAKHAFNHPRTAPGLPVPRGGDGTPDRPQMGNPKEGWIGRRLAHVAWEMSKVVIKRLHEF